MAFRTEIEDYVPPNSLEAEMCALGSMLLSERAIEECMDLLSESEFYSPAHREIFLAISQLAGKRAVDLVTVKNELVERGKLQSIGGVDYLVQVAESVPSPGNAVHYAGIVRDKATLRRLEMAGHDIVQLVHNPDKDALRKVEEAEAMVYSVGKQSMGSELVPVKSLAKEFFIEIDAFYESGQPLLGVPSGFTELDRMTGGMYPGDFTIVAARPSMGKTSLVLNFALNVAKREVGNVAVFSLEMSGKQLARRLLSMISNVGMGALKRSRLPDDDYRKLADACEMLYSLPIYIDDASEVTPLQMKQKCRRLKQDGGLALIVVDYLQLMRGGGRTENRVQEMGEIARGLKGLSKELDVPLIALSQLNRGVESREDKRPMLSDIRESGSIEAEADLVMMIYRDAYYKQKEEGTPYDQDPNRVEEAEIIIAKHRNGPTGKVMLGFQPNYARFMNLARSEYES